MPRAPSTPDHRLLQGVNRRSLDLVNAALNEGANPNRTVAVDEQGHSPTAGPRARTGNVHGVGTFAPAMSGVRPVVSLLIWAIRQGTPAIVERLIDAGADVAACEPCMGRSPVLEAARAGQVRSLRALLAAGAEVNVTDHPGETAFSWQHSKVRTVLIGAGFDLNLQGMGGRRPLHDAAMMGDAQKVRWCLGHGARVDVRDDDLATPLHLAAIRSDPDTLRALFEAGADPGAVDNKGDTPGTIAHRRGASEAGRRFQEVLTAHEQKVLGRLSLDSETNTPVRRRQRL